MSRERLSFSAELQTSDPALLAELFGDEHPTPGSSAPLAPGVVVRVDAIDVRRGLIETAVLVHFVVTVATGVATKVIGDLLSERLKSRKAKLAIDGRRVSEPSSDRIADAIEKASHAE